MKLIVLLIAIFSILAIFAYGQVPTGPDSIARESDERRTDFSQSPVSLEGQAGNLSLITINATSVSGFWQGFYGNITGRVTLDDFDNNTFYDWTDQGATFAGRIFASNDTITTWANVTCLNFSSTSNQDTNLSKLEVHYGMNAGDPQGFDETFISLSGITVDSVILSNCNSTNLFTNSSRDSSRWNVSLLTINLTNTVIFAQQLENDYFGFDNNTYDFQLIVADRADTGPGGTTTYFIYIELN